MQELSRQSVDNGASGRPTSESAPPPMQTKVNEGRASVIPHIEPVKKPGQVMITNQPTVEERTKGISNPPENLSTNDEIVNVIGPEGCDVTAYRNIIILKGKNNTQ